MNPNQTKPANSLHITLATKTAPQLRVGDLDSGVMFRDDANDIGLRTDDGVVYFTVLEGKTTPYHMTFTDGDGSTVRNIVVKDVFGSLVVSLDGKQITL